ncbi:MAG: hypothetical protein RL215_324 [Planctomycetota bacterium]
MEAAGDEAGFAICGDLFTAIEASEGGTGEEWPGALADSGVEEFPGDVFREDEVEVAGDGGESGEWGVVAGGLEELFEDGESEFSDADIVLEFGLIEEMSGEFSDPAEVLSVDGEFSAAAMGEFRAVSGLGFEDGVWCEGSGEAFDDTEDGGEASAGDETDGEWFGLLFGLSGTGGEVDAGNFEEFGVGSAVSFILSAALE